MTPTKYKFSGHLWPLPPGVRLPLQLCGEVYLPSEVEGEIERLTKRIALLERQNSKLCSVMSAKRVQRILSGEQ